MNIRMYDCHFGDCFKLKSNVNDIPLIVDFGIHDNSKFISTTRSGRYDQIISDFDNNQDFLLTHYHEDHYDGVIYAADTVSYQFNDIYIPDIWNMKPEAIALVLLRGMVVKYIVKTGLTLIDFLIAICKQNGTIHFVQRGTTIQNKYIALWPTKKFIEERAGKLFGTIRGKHERNGDHSTFFSELLEVAERLRIIVSEQGGNAVEELLILNDRLKTLIQNHPYFSNADKIKLAKFGIKM